MAETVVGGSVWTAVASSLRPLWRALGGAVFTGLRFGVEKLIELSSAEAARPPDAMFIRSVFRGLYSHVCNSVLGVHRQATGCM